tara:strand:+ start:573 stop:938 length:366 start_codon:yes stop_codon:yes gene_type:complete
MGKSKYEHYSMKDQEDWNDEDMKMFQRDECRVEPDPYEKAKQEPEWDETVGKCYQLLTQVLFEQKGHEVSVIDFNHLVVEFATVHLMFSAPCTLRQAGIILMESKPLSAMGEYSKVPAVPF